MPVRRPVDPEVLGESAVGALPGREVDQGAERPVGRAGGEQRLGRVDHVAGPDEMVAAPRVVAARRTPGDRQRGDERTGEDLVLVRQEDRPARAEQSPPILRDAREGGLVRRAAGPLFAKATLVDPERGPQRLQQGRHGRFDRLAEGDPERELGRAPERDLAQERDVAVRRPVELLGQAPVLREFGEPVARPHVPHRGVRERAGREHGDRESVLLGGEDGTSEHLVDRRRVPPAPDVEVGRREGEHPQARGEAAVRDLDAGVREQDGQVRVAEHGLLDPVPPVRVLGRDHVLERPIVRTARLGAQVSLLLVEERLAVREQELHVAELGPVDPGEVDLRDDPPPDRVPESRVGRVGRADAVLVAVRPAGHDPRGPGCDPIPARVHRCLRRRPAGAPL